MSSGPKRKGCDVCRKRHVKCDRQTPSCAQCLKAGWACPGYSSDFSFVNYSQKFPTGRSRGNQDEGSSSSRARSSSRPRGEGSNTPIPLSRIMPRTLTPASPPASTTESLKQKFLWALENGNIAANFETLSPKSYLRLFPDLLGRSQAMDDAMHLITLASTLPYGSRDPSTSSSQPLISAHAASIGSLRAALADDEKVKETGTMAAALLLQMYEQHNNKDSPARAFHVKGVSKLIQNRGSESFQDEVDLAILEAELAHIFFSCIREEEECFLAEPAWRDVFVRMAQVQPSQGPGRMSPEQLDLMNAWCFMPGALAAFHDWMENEDAIQSGQRNRESLSPPRLTGSSSDSVSLTEYLVMHRRRLREWWERHLPIPANANQGPWTASYDLVVLSSIAVQLGCVDYMLAGVSPSSAFEEHQIRIDGEQRDRTSIDLGAHPYDLPSDLVGESRHLALIIRKYARHQPDHPFFAEGSMRLSLKYVWEKTKDHQSGHISEDSTKIAEMLDWAFSSGRSGFNLVDRTR